MGRPKINGDGQQLMARFPDGTLERIADALKTDETKADFIRKAVETELKKRERKK